MSVKFPIVLLSVYLLGLLIGVEMGSILSADMVVLSPTESLRGEAEHFLGRMVVASTQ